MSQVANIDCRSKWLLQSTIYANNQMFCAVGQQVKMRQTPRLLVFPIVRQHNKTLIGLDKPRKKRYDIFLSRAYTPAKLEQKLLFAAVKLSGSQLRWLHKR